MQQDKSKSGNRQTKVGWLVRGLGAGGAEHLLLQDAVELSPHYEISVAHTMSDRRHLEAQFVEAGVAVKLISVGHNRIMQKLGVSWLLPLRSWLVEFKPDVIHCHSPVLAIAVRLLMKCRLIPLTPIVYTEHNESKARHVVTRTLNTLTMRFDSKLICVSKSVEESFNHPPSHSEVLVHGVNVKQVLEATKARTAVRDKWDVSSSDIVVGMMANFRPEKNHSLAFQAAKQIISKYKNVYFVFYGQGILEKKLKEEIAELGLKEQFLFEGYTDTPHEQMSGFDIILLPSVHEGLPVVLMDAIVMCIPAVVTRNAGMDDIYSEDQAVYLDAASAQSIAGALEELVDGDNGLKRRSQISTQLKCLTGKYSSEQYYKRLTDIYDNLAQ